MITKKTSLFLFLFIIFYSTILSQESRRPFNVSPLIGDTLSSAENEYFNLFPKIEGFQQAVFYRNSNDSLDAKVTSLLNNTSRETLLKNNFSRTELINHLERVAKAKSFWGIADTSIVQNIIIKTKDGVIKEGTLISVSDSLVLIKPLENESLLKYNKDSTEEYSYLQITSVTIQNDSKVLSGMGTGFLVGAGFGASIGLIDGDDTGFIYFTAGQKALLGGLSLGILGALIGAAVGAGSSEDDEIIIKTKDDLKYLKKYLRNPFNEIDTRKIRSIIKQNTDTIEKPEISFKKHVGIVIFGATTSSGPAAQIEYQMGKSGFNQTTHSGWFNSGDIVYPKSYTGFGQLGTPWLILLKYYYNKSFVLGTFYSENPIGMTMGHNDISGYLDLNYSVNTFATIAWFKYGILSIGGGPALYFTKTWEDYSNNSSDKTNLGFVIDLELTYPSYSSFFVAAMVQYRIMKNTEIGSFEIGYHDNKSIFRTTEVSYNHLFVGVGTGIRL